MNYTAVWMPHAVQSLASIWMAAADGNAVNAAANAIDRALAWSPNSTGVVLFDTVREHTHPPLGVEFEVVDATRTVYVLSCWDTATGRPAVTGN